jgi:cystathionine beta-lyase
MFMVYDFNAVIDRSGTYSAKWDLARDGVLPMWVADMDFESPREVVDAIVERASHGTFGYTLTPSTYYKAIIDWMSERHRWEIKKDWIAITPGVLPALCFALAAFTEPGDKVVLQAPVYHPFPKLISRNGRKPVENRMKFDGGRYEMDYDGLESMIDEKTKMLVLCSPHNPVGRVWKKDELLRLAEICTRRGVLVIADEIHADIIMDGHKHVPFATLSDEIAANTITLTAASKTFNLAGLACSNVIISNKDLYDKFESAVGDMHVESPNMFGMLGTQAGYLHGKPWLAELLVHLKGNYDFLVSYLQDNAPAIKPSPLEGTYLVWLDFSEFGLSDMQIKTKLLKEAGVWLDFGPQFGTGGEGFQRMNIACPRSTLEDGLSRIAKVFGP